MRLLDINNLYSPTGGGVRSYHERRAAYHAARGEVRYGLVVPSDHTWHRVDDGVERFGVPALPLGSSGYRQIVGSRGLADVLASFRPDVVEVGSVYTLPRALRRAAKQDFATVGFYHADYPDTYVAPVARRLGAAVERRAVAAASRHMGRAYGQMTAVFGASEHVLRKLSAAGVRRLFHTPLGVDIDTFTPRARSLAWRASVRVNDDRPVVLYAGRLGMEKGVAALLDAWPRVAGRESMRLVIVGHGPLQRRVEAFAASHAEVVTLGYLDGAPKVAEAMASSEVFLSLGGFETFSLTTLEALACGPVVVAARDGGAGELAARARMPACNVHDPAELASAIERAVSQAGAGADARGVALASEMSWDAAFDRMTCYQHRIHDAFRRGDFASLEPEGPWHPVTSDCAS